MRNSIYGRPKAQPEPSSQAQPLPPQPIRRENPQQSLSHNSAIQQYLNMRRITKDKGCLIIFIFYCIGLVIMMGIGFFFGNYSDLGYFVNDGAAVAEQRNCNSLYLSEDFTSCVDTCVSNFAFLKRVSIYNPTLYDSVPGLIQMNNIKITFPMITYVSGGLLIATGILFILAISLPKIIYLYIFALFLMLLGMAFYLLKNFQLRIQSLSIQPGSIFYTEQQNTRAISFFLLGVYLLIFPFVLFSPKKIQLGTFLLSKISEFFKTMRKTIIFSMFVILVTWGSLIIEIFLVMHFYTSGQISQTPRASMFHTYDNINLSHPAALVFHFIGVFWFYATLISWHKYFISSAMCLWYFQDSQSMYQIRRGLKRSRHHVGTAALDGILLPFEWLFLFLYSVLKISDNENQQQQQPSCLSSCFRSIRQFFMSIYSSVNRCSPSSAVLTNQNYLQSSRTASQIFSTNSHRFFNIGGTLTIFLTLFTSILWLLIMYFIVYFEIYGKEFPSQITSVVLPVFCVFVIALVVGSLFANLFTASVDCLLFCYLMERKSLEEGEFQRDQGELKIKTVLDQCYYKSVEEAKTSVFIYQEKDENTLDVIYVAKKQ